MSELDGNPIYDRFSPHDSNEKQLDTDQTASGEQSNLVYTVYPDLEVQTRSLV